VCNIAGKSVSFTAEKLLLTGNRVASFKVCIL
jgi:hypothetical protein